MVAFSKVRAGDILYEVSRRRAGNTTMSRTCNTMIRVESVDPERRRAVCRAGSRSRVYTERMLKKLRRSPAGKRPASELEIAEGVSSVWHYHLRVRGEIKSLCGASVMISSMPLRRWNTKIPDYHIPESFCRACDDAFKNRPPETG